jgi:hypothetical protein
MMMIVMAAVTRMMVVVMMMMMMTMMTIEVDHLFNLLSAWLLTPRLRAGRTCRFSSCWTC